MKVRYSETISNCHVCAAKVRGIYWETEDGIFLETICETDGSSFELVERDKEFFKSGYEYDGYKPIPHLILPITYRCDLACKFCYAHSNYKHNLPEDRSINRIIEIINDSGCKVVNLAGGEPTVRKDLPELISEIKKRCIPDRLSIVTNGQNTRDFDFMKMLKSSGIDFIFLPLSIPGYEQDGIVMNRVMQSFENASNLQIPVWIQITLQNLEQIPPALALIEKYKSTIFHITIRVVKAYGIRSPEQTFVLSDILKSLGKQNNWAYGSHPFNRIVRISGRKAKISCWVNDFKMLEPYDGRYVIHDDSIVPFHRGMILDDLYFKSLSTSK